MTGILEGIRIIDLTRALAGPFCTMVLADMGADVIKVEVPEKGDETRNYGPFWNGESTYFMSANRNKRSLTLNLKEDEGREIFLRLFAGTDIVIENFRTGTMQRFGLGYDTLRQRSPGLIYCSIAGFGRTGPRAEQAGYDLLMQAFGGMMSVTGEPGRPPVRVGQSVIDLATGMFCLTGILGSLYHREKTGRGQRIDISLLGSQVSWLNYLAVAYFCTGEVPEPAGSGHAGLVPYQAFPTADGHIVIGVGNDGQYRRLCGALEREDLVEDPRFSTMQQRVDHRESMIPLLEEAFRKKATAAWVDRLTRADVPCSPVNRLDQVFSDPQVDHDGYVVAIPHPKIPDFQMPGNPLRFSETQVTVRRPPPMLGEHTEEVLEELGYSPHDIASFQSRGIV